MDFQGVLLSNQAQLIVQLQHRRPRARRERRRRLPPPEAQGGPRRAGPRRQRVGPRQRGARRQRRGAGGEPARRRAVRGAAAHRALRGGRARARYVVIVSIVVVFRPRNHPPH